MKRIKNLNFKDISRYPKKFSFLEMLILVAGLAIGIIVYQQTMKISNEASNARVFEQKTRKLIIAVSQVNTKFITLLSGSTEVSLQNDVYSQLDEAESLCSYIDEYSGVQGEMPPINPSYGSEGPKATCEQLQQIRNLIEQKWADYLSGKPDSYQEEYENSLSTLMMTLELYNDANDPRLQESDRKTRQTNLALSVCLVITYTLIALIVRHTRTTLTAKTHQLETEIELRSKLNDDLDAERNLINTLVENIPDAVFAKDSQGLFLVANAATAFSLGVVHKEELIGKSEADFCPPKIAERIRDEDVRVLSSGETLRENQATMLDPVTGNPRWWQTTKIPLRNSSGEITRLVGISRDITKQKEIEGALQNANEKLTEGISALEQNSREAERISELVDLLQASRNTEEACEVIAEQMERFFPQDDGILYLFHPSRNMLDKAISWGNPLQDPVVMKPDDCWGLRRGRMHIVHANQVDSAKAGHSLVCSHIFSTNPADYLCVPLVAQGEALGLMHLCHPQPDLAAGEWYDQRKKRRIHTIIDSLSLAMANLRLRETLREQTIRDPLTGLFNRRYMEETLEREILRAKRNEEMIGLIMIDVDHFKKFNDTYGHQAGDALLSSLGNSLRTHVRGEDVACRYGGEEFVLVLPGAKLEPTEKRAEDLVEKVRNLKILFEGQALGPITISAGVAVYPTNGSTAGTLIQAADQVLYRAKTEGRDRVVVA